jgi:hypothetical protein
MDLVTGKVKESQDIINQVMEAMRTNKDIGLKATFLRGMGVDRETLNFLLGDMQKYIEMAGAMGAATEKMTEDAQKATSAWAAFKITMETFWNWGMARGFDAFEWLRRKGTGMEPPDIVDFRANFGGGGGGPEHAAMPIQLPLPRPGAPSPPTGGLPIGTAMFVQQLRNEGHRITSIQGGEHLGTAHPAGLAIDFVSADIPGEVKRLREKLASMGVAANVYDESKRPVGRPTKWTGRHGHVEFANLAAAEKFAAMGGLTGAGVTNNSSINIQTINMNGTNVRDAPTFARTLHRGLKAELGAVVTQANGGHQ